MVVHCLGSSNLPIHLPVGGKAPDRRPSLLNTEVLESLQEFIYFSHVVVVVVVVGAQHLLLASLSPLSPAGTFCAIATCVRARSPLTIYTQSFCSENSGRGKRVACGLFHIF